MHDCMDVYWTRNIDRSVGRFDQSRALLSERPIGPPYNFIMNSFAGPNSKQKSQHFSAPFLSQHHGAMRKACKIMISI